MKVRFLKLIILPTLLSLVPNQLKADIYTFEQSSATSGEISPSYWTFDLPSFGSYFFATWYSRRTNGNNGDTWLHLFQESTPVSSNDDQGKTDIFNASEGLVPGLTTRSDVGPVTSLINYDYSSGSATHTLLLGNYPYSRSCLNLELDDAITCIENQGTSSAVINTKLFSNVYGTLVVADTGDATYSISGDTYAGSTLTAAVSVDDPDGNGTVTSYTWQSSSDGSTWSDISGATNSTYTVTSAEEGKSIRVTVEYTDGSSTSESVTASSVSISQLHTEWVQPYAAMQNVGLKSIHNNRDLVLAKAGECNNYGWMIGDTDYCVYTNANNKVSYVNGDTTRGSYGSAVFNGSINLEKTINDKWKAGVAYGQGTSNLYNFNFSGTTANLDSSNNHYSVYGVKKVNDIFTLKGMVGGSVFDYKGNRNYLTTSATSSYETDGYTAEINGTWDLKKNIKNMKNPIRLQPTVGVAFAAHAQDGFSESGSGDLITVDPNQAESFLLKTGIGVDKEIIMEGGKWLLVPSLALNYEMDTYASKGHRDLKGGLTESSTAHTSVEAKTFGQHRGSLKVGADFVLTKDFMFNLNAEYGLATYGDENSYGGGFRWQF